LDRLHDELRDEIHDAIGRVLRDSAFVLGTEVERFEERFAQYCGTEYCVGVSSGTSALQLMLQAAGVGPGDEVIVPAHTFIASALAVVHAGATPVLCDVDAATGLLDASAVTAAVGPRTAAVIAVHLYGQVCDVDAITAVARRHGLLVFEDAAQAHGARYKEKRAGSLGVAAAFSFYPAKNLGALGDGGAVCTSDREIAAAVRRLRNIGQRSKGEHVVVGYCERLDGLQAAILSVKLPHLDRWNDLRRQHAARYDELLDGSVRSLPATESTPCTYHLYPIRVQDRDGLADRLGAAGIETGIHYYPAVHGHEAWVGHSLRCPSVVEAEAWAAEELSLPMHPCLREDEIERVVGAIRGAMRTAAPRSRA
jgi:dTDP-4-amino-4,6-dideoxygalactose transaminase